MSKDYGTIKNKNNEVAIASSNIYIGGGSLDNLINYSTNEVKIGTWLGEPLYRVCYSFMSPPQSGSYYTVYNIPNFTPSKVVKIEGVIEANYVGDIVFYNLNFDERDEIHKAWIALHKDGRIQMNVGTEFIDLKTYVNLYYTKTS